MNKVFIFPNFTKSDTTAVTESAVHAFYELGFSVYLEEESREYLSAAVQKKCGFFPYASCLEKCEFITVIGGDGSILRIATDAARNRKPILGINTGKVGFMSELDPHELIYLRDLVKGNYTIDSRMMLDATILRGNKTLYHAPLLNDAVITKGTLVRLINIDVSINGTRTTALRGDGIIVSTPTGSTAYTLSAGGPIIEPNANCIAVTPICAHELGAKPFVVSDDRKIEILAGTSENPAFFSPDGAAPLELSPADIVVLERSQLKTKLIRLKNLGFYDIVYKKLSK